MASFFPRSLLSICKRKVLLMCKPLNDTIVAETTLWEMRVSSGFAIQSDPQSPQRKLKRHFQEARSESTKTYRVWRGQNIRKGCSIQSWNLSDCSKSASGRTCKLHNPWRTEIGDAGEIQQDASQRQWQGRFTQRMLNLGQIDKSYTAFNSNIRLDIHKDFETGPALAKQLRFSSKKSRGKTASLADYVTRMSEHLSSLAAHGRALVFGTDSELYGSPFRDLRL